jgi:hypothetical protein
MPERFGDILTMLMSALAVGYLVYEIEREPDDRRHGNGRNRR